MADGEIQEVEGVLVGFWVGEVASDCGGLFEALGIAAVRVFASPDWDASSLMIARSSRICLGFREPGYKLSLQFHNWNFTGNVCVHLVRFDCRA